jgi:two-component system nitrate/nitrite response regulator NarL
MTVPKGKGKPKPITVPVVDDYKTWRHFFWATLQGKPELQLVGEASDGMEAVHRAEQRQPELILLDISVPALNGIEAAGRIGKVSSSKILFVSVNRSPDVTRAALNNGGVGYVVKADAAKDLLPAIRAVLAGKRSVSGSLAGDFLSRMITGYAVSQIVMRILRLQVAHAFSQR